MKLRRIKQHNRMYYWKVKVILHTYLISLRDERVNFMFRSLLIALIKYTINLLRLILYIVGDRAVNDYASLIE